MPMPNPEGETRAGAGGAEWFATTCWTVVLAAGDSASPAAEAALETLCGAYWYPLYAYVRRQGHSPEDAQDLTQEFFAGFLEKKRLRAADRSRGRFRSFLLTSLKHFLVSEWRRDQAQKRGGGAPKFALDALTAEERFRLEPADELTPDKVYERSWAWAVLDRVRTELRREHAAAGQAARLELLEQFLPGQRGELTYAEAARQLGLAEGTVKSEVHHLKQRYRALLRAAVAHTVATPGEINDELRHLMAALGG